MQSVRSPGGAVLRTTCPALFWPVKAESYALQMVLKVVMANGRDTTEGHAPNEVECRHGYAIVVAGRKTGKVEGDLQEESTAEPSRRRIGNIEECEKKRGHPGWWNLKSNV